MLLLEISPKQSQVALVATGINMLSFRLFYKQIERLLRRSQVRSIQEQWVCFQIWQVETALRDGNFASPGILKYPSAIKTCNQINPEYQMKLTLHFLRICTGKGHYLAVSSSCIILALYIKQQSNLLLITLKVTFLRNQGSCFRNSQEFLYPVLARFIVLKSQVG